MSSREEIDLANVSSSPCQTVRTCVLSVGMGMGVTKICMIVVARSASSTALQMRSPALMLSSLIHMMHDMITVSSGMFIGSDHQQYQWHHLHCKQDFCCYDQWHDSSQSQHYMLLLLMSATILFHPNPCLASWPLTAPTHASW